MASKIEKNPAEANLKDNAPDGLALSDKELAEARKEGAKEDVQANAKDVHHALTDGNLPGNGPDMRWHGSDEIQEYAFRLDGSLDDLKKSFDAGAIPDVKLYGLLALERNGQNRTDWVKYMVDTLDLDGKDRDKDQPLAAALPGGGPSFTNDKTAVTDL